eukprot:TRINITY_DN485_c0_g9_i1.p1 TRINITY_DN485_c0_g9~~TRINITY_DN485_c0_g9_i1.p1  ORF type:complete len:290 (+),score=73.23 TRINITY_DN485_c0_g9_i1:36-905(+)
MFKGVFLSLAKSTGRRQFSLFAIAARAAQLNRHQQSAQDVTKVPREDFVAQLWTGKADARAKDALLGHSQTLGIEEIALSLDLLRKQNVQIDQASHSKLERRVSDLLYADVGRSPLSFFVVAAAHLQAAGQLDTQFVVRLKEFVRGREEEVNAFAVVHLIRFLAEEAKQDVLFWGFALSKFNEHYLNLRPEELQVALDALAKARIFKADVWQRIQVVLSRLLYNISPTQIIHLLVPFKTIGRLDDQLWLSIKTILSQNASKISSNDRKLAQDLARTLNGGDEQFAQLFA